MIIDGGSCDIGVESTIVKIDGEVMTLLRPGGITLEMLCAIGDVKLDKVITEKLGEGERPLAPGMMYRHYAPDTRVVMLDGTNEQIYNFLTEREGFEKAGMLLFEDELLLFSALGITLVSMGAHTPESEAHSLFAKLREVDKYGRDVFYIKVPDRSGIGLAIYNRMLKACGHTVITL